MDQNVSTAGRSARLYRALSQTNRAIVRVGDRAPLFEEICRGVTMVTDLGAYPAPIPGWIHVDCFSEAMAGRARLVPRLW